MSTEKIGKERESDKENSEERVDRNNYEIDAIFNIYGTQIFRITGNK